MPKNIGLHVINIYRFIWDPESPRPDWAVEGSKAFLMSGKRLLVLPDGKLITAGKVEGLPVFNAEINLDLEKNLDFFSRFEENILVDRGLFRVRQPCNSGDIKIIISGEFGDQAVVAGDDGCLCLQSIYDHFKETDPMDGIPKT